MPDQQESRGIGTKDHPLRRPATLPPQHRGRGLAAWYRLPKGDLAFFRASSASTVSAIHAPALWLTATSGDRMPPLRQHTDGSRFDEPQANLSQYLDGAACCSSGAGARVLLAGQLRRGPEASCRPCRTGLSQCKHAALTQISSSTTAMASDSSLRTGDIARLNAHA
jgi:hypothetical protein